MMSLTIHCFFRLLLFLMVIIFFLTHRGESFDLSHYSLIKALHKMTKVQVRLRMSLKLKSTGGPLRFYITLVVYFFIFYDKFHVYNFSIPIFY